MFDITQVKSGLNNKDLKEDITYVDELLSEVIYIEEINEEVLEEIPSYLDEIDRLKSISHEHENMAILNKITNEMVDSWDAKSMQITKVSQLQNDSDFISKKYIDDEIKKHTTADVILVSPNGTKFSLTVEEDGALNATRLITEA